MTAEPVTVPTVADVERHLRETYAGVFGEAAIAHHVSGHVGMEPARELVSHVLSRAPGSRSALDVGCGYGSFVLGAREAGIEAFGVELAGFELRFARGRLMRERPLDDQDAVYVSGSGLELPFSDDRFDIVTLWNVVEHVHDTRRLLAEAVRVLAPGGRLFLLAPNYAAFRREAHYLVPWFPLLPRSIARTYLRALGRNPRFLEESVVYCTPVGVRRVLDELPVVQVEPAVDKLRSPVTIRQPRARALASLAGRLGLVRPMTFAVRAAERNPLRKVISVEAVKESNRP